MTGDARSAERPELDDLDRQIINTLQGGFPLCTRPFAVAALPFGISERELIDRVRRLLEVGALSRFGPMVNADRMGGGFCLCALSAPAERYEEVTEIVNGFIEVAHNYARDHRLNMWFVIAAERPERVDEVVREIEQATGLDVFAFPKEEEYFVEFKVAL
ncbi:MAG: AsnC family protein [Hyphomicrobiales bacterium]|nr:MAG: AsnC family protein [Hyphomicrobiales bacterium]